MVVPSDEATSTDSPEDPTQEAEELVSLAAELSHLGRGHLPCHRTGRLWRIRKDQLLSFLERGPSPADAAVSLEERATRLLARRAR